MTAKTNTNEINENGFVQRLSDLPIGKEIIFNGIGRKATKSGYPVIYLFADNEKPVMVYETSKTGQELLKNFNRLKTVEFGLTLSSYHSKRFNKDIYQVDKIRKIKDKEMVELKQTELEGFEE